MDIERIRELIEPALQEFGVVDLTRELVRLNSVNPPGNELQVAEFIARYAERNGLQATLRPFVPGRANVVVRLQGAGKGPGLMYCGHLDTVPTGELDWDWSPFCGDLVNGRILGRGSADMKGGVAAMLTAMAVIHRAGIQLPGDMVFAGVAGEEVDCLGSTQLLADGGLTGMGWLVLGEPTRLDLVPAHKGALRVQAITHGRAAHGAVPHLGVNALVHMAHLIQGIASLKMEAPSHPLLSPPTLSINQVMGGHAINIVPDLCKADMDIRTVPGQSHSAVLDQLEAIARELTFRLADFRAEFIVLHERPPVETSVDDPLMAAARWTMECLTGKPPAIRGISYFTDASVLQPATGIPVLIAGPGDEALAHQRNESVEVESLLAAQRFYAVLPYALFGLL